MKYSLEELMEIATEIVNISDKIKEDRKSVMYTGRIGYIKYLETMFNRELTLEEKFAIPEGYYKI
jgi:hypothetical protein